MEYLGGGSALDLMKAGSLEEVGIFKLLIQKKNWIFIQLLTSSAF